MAFDNDNTKLQDAIVLLNGTYGLDEWQKRSQHHGVLKGFIDDTARTLPAAAIEANRTTARRPVKLPYLVEYNPTILNTRSCTIVCDPQTSQYYSLTWNTIGFSVCYNPIELADSYITDAEYIAHQMNRGFEYAYRTLDTAAVAALETNKTAVVDAGSTYRWAHNGSAYQVPLADIDDIYLEMPQILMYNDVHDFPVNDFHTINAGTLKTKLGEFGVNNERNRAGEVANDMFTGYYSKNVANGVGVGQTHYFVPPASLGFMSWVDFDARRNSRIHESKYWTTMQDPMFAQNWGVYYNADCGDSSANVTGAERTKQEKWEFSMDYAYVTAIPDPAGITPIFKVEGLTT